MHFGVLAATLFLAGCTSSTTPPTVYIGFVASDGAADREASRNARRGIELALRHFNKNPDKAMTVLVREAEVSDKPEAFESAATRLVSVNGVKALLGGRTVAEAERLDRGGAPVLSPVGWRSRGMTEDAFTTGLSAVFRGKVLARFAAEELKLKRVAVLADEHSEEAVELAEAFSREWPTAAGDPKVHRPRTELFGKQAKLTDLLAHAQKEEVQAVLLAGNVEGDWPIAKVPILFGGDEGEYSQMRKLSGVVYATTAFVRDEDTKEVKEFVQEFRGLHQEDPDVNAALAYDDTRILLQALGKSVSPFEAPKLRKALAETEKFAGLTGSLGFDKEQRLSRPAFVVRWEGGQAKTVRKFSP
jgi:branched-chain amino acid transport system substrate-binding protein